MRRAAETAARTTSSISTRSSTSGSLRARSCRSSAASSGSCAASSVSPGSARAGRQAVLAQVVDEHEEIVEALEHRDPETAFSALVEHLHKSDYAIAEKPRTREGETR